MFTALFKTILVQIEQYIRYVDQENFKTSTEELVIMGNIATAKHAGGDNGKLTDKIVATIVNISEDGPLKNQTNNKIVNGSNVVMHPVVHINLFVLFSSNFDQYEKAVNCLIRVIEFFQGNITFNSSLLGSSIQNNKLPVPGRLELAVDLHTLSFEQLNDLWGSLGGKQMPFVLYKIRLLPVQMEKIISQEALITEIEGHISAGV